MFVVFLAIVWGYEEPPITIENPTMSTVDSGFHSFSDESQAVNALVTSLNMDGNAAWSFVNKLKYASKAKTSLFTFEMGVDTDQTWRNALMKVALLSGKKENGAFVLRCHIVSTNAAVNAYYIEVKKKKKKFMGVTYGSKKRIQNKWRPLTPEELQEVYSRLQSTSSSTIESIATSL